MLRDWPTLGLIVLCYAGWALATTWLAGVWLPAAIVVTALLIALQSSLQHEALHGHPFRNRRLNEALVFLTLNLAIPYGRFRDTHLEHHRDAMLTDPYDDPETNYIDPVIWEATPGWIRRVLGWNNTLIGRMILGPLIGQVTFMRSEGQLIADGDRAVLRDWLLHGVSAGIVLIWIVGFAAMPLWAYVLAAYAGLSILKLRTFLEHQAHESARGRTVVIADRGLFALLFLNNNYHVVHHMHPRVPWFQLPALFAGNRDKYLRRNHGYFYDSYWNVIRAHAFRAKDSVPHPLWRGDQRLRPLPERFSRRQVR